MVQVRVLSTIGPMQLVAQHEGRASSADEIARMTIPDEALPDLAFKALHRMYHNRMVSAEVWDMCDVIREMKRPAGKEG